MFRDHIGQSGHQVVLNLLACSHEQTQEVSITLSPPLRHIAQNSVQSDLYTCLLLPLYQFMDRICDSYSYSNKMNIDTSYFS